MSAESFQFGGVEIPIELLQRTGAGAETFALIARLHLDQFAAYAPIAPDHRVLELASGIGRDALLLMSLLDGRGRYDGFDLDRDSIRWCTNHLSRSRPNFRFHHANLRSTQYNPNGLVNPSEFTFPVEDGCIDRAFAQSLFTHLLPEATARYLAETRRVLKPDGLAMYTFFTGDESEIRSSESSTVPFFRIVHRHADGCFVYDPAIPESSVAYTSERLLDLIQEAGLELARPVVGGSWVPNRAGAAGHAQDLVVLRHAN